MPSHEIRLTKPDGRGTITGSVSTEGQRPVNVLDIARATPMTPDGIRQLAARLEDDVQPVREAIAAALANVAEFCRDWYGERTYELSPDRDPSGPATGELRVVRGGSWRDTLEETSSVRRARFRVDKESITVGFRGVKPAIATAPPR